MPGRGGGVTPAAEASPCRPLFLTWPALRCPIAGFNRCLLHLLVVWALTQQCKALSSAPKQVRPQVPSLHCGVLVLLRMIRAGRAGRHLWDEGLPDPCTHPTRQQQQACCWACWRAFWRRCCHNTRAASAPAIRADGTTGAGAVQVHLPTLDPAKQYAADFRMQATSYAAYMMVRDYQTVRVPAAAARRCFLRAGMALEAQQWLSCAPAWSCSMAPMSMHACLAPHQAGTDRTDSQQQWWLVLQGFRVVVFVGITQQRQHTQHACIAFMR